MRLGEDLRREEEEKLSQRGDSSGRQAPSIFQRLPQMLLAGSKPTCSAFNFTLNICPRPHQFENRYSEQGFGLIRSVPQGLPVWHQAGESVENAGVSGRYVQTREADWLHGN